MAFMLQRVSGRERPGRREPSKEARAVCIRAAIAQGQSLEAVDNDRKSTTAAGT